MATVKGTIKTIADAATVDHINDRGAGEGAILHVTADTYTAAALAQGSLIEIGSKIPIGSYVYEAIVAYGALGASTSISLGDAEDDDRYVSNTVTTSAGFTRLNNIAGFVYKIDETDTTNTDRQVLAKVVDSGAMTGSIKAAIFWA